MPTVHPLPQQLYFWDFTAVYLYRFKRLFIIMLFLIAKVKFLTNPPRCFCPAGALTVALKYLWAFLAGGPDSSFRAARTAPPDKDFSNAGYLC